MGFPIMRRYAPLAILAVGLGALMAVSAEVRIEGKRQTVAIELAARGIKVAIQPAGLECGVLQAGQAACVASPKPRPV